MGPLWHQKVSRPEIREISNPDRLEDSVSFLYVLRCTYSSGLISSGLISRRFVEAKRLFWKCYFLLHQVEKLPTGDGISVYFECENLDNYVNSLIEKGIIFDEMPSDKNWLWREARLKDLDGNKLILYFAGENRINPPWKI